MSLIITVAAVLSLGLVEGVVLGFASGVVIFYIGYVAKRGYKKRYERQKDDIKRRRTLRQMHIGNDSEAEIVTKDGYTTATTWKDDGFESDIIHSDTPPKKKKLKHLVPSDNDLVYDWLNYYSPIAKQGHTPTVALEVE